MSAPAPIIVHQEITAGDDYKAAEGRALTWQSPQWPNLAGASISLVWGFDQANILGASPVTWTTIQPSTPASTLATVELSHEQTKEAAEGCFDYVLRAVLADGDTFTLATGQLTISVEPGLALLDPII